MGGWLLVLALIGVIVWAFTAAFRRRARANLDRLGLELPAELTARRVPAPAPGTPAVVAAATPVRPAPVVPTGGPAAHYLLIYELPADFSRRRVPFRDEHLGLAWQAAERGELMLAGALEEPAAQAFLLFRGSREVAQRFAAADPYVRHGLVAQWQVRQWHTVAGAQAATPVRPAQAL